MKKFKEELHSKGRFYSLLTDREINMFLMFRKNIGMKSMKEYHDLYLECDVLESDVFEKFRNNSLKNFVLCPSHYKLECNA